MADDAIFTFDKKDWRDQLRSAEEVHAMSLANLGGEYCKVVSTDWALKRTTTNSNS
jgi:hypothetical protein